MRDIRWVVNWSALFVEAVFEWSFGFTYVLFGAVVALYHVNDVFGVTVNAQLFFLRAVQLNYLHHFRIEIAGNKRQTVGVFLAQLVVHVNIILT